MAKSLTDSAVKPSELLRELDKLPSKKLGQNFLVDDKVINDMVTTAELTNDETVIEIGPGLGSLTLPLLTAAKKVIAIEADRELAEYLRRKNHQGLTIITGDALQTDWSMDINEPYKIVANIPYSITFPLIRQAFLMEKRPVMTVLLVQKEVAERLIAQPGSSERGLPTVRVEANATAIIIRKVKPGSFYPSPNVDSAIVRLTLGENHEAKVFWPAVEAGFRHKRQTLANCLKTDLHLPRPKVEKILTKAGIDLMARAQVLSFEDWVKLSTELKTVELS